MTAPDDVHAALDQRPGQAGSLGIVQEDDVARADPSIQLCGVVVQHRGVVVRFARSEILAVARRTVEPVVQTLGDGEKAVVATDDDPPGVDPGVVGISDEEAKHLGDPATGRSGADVPNPGPADESLELGGRLQECFDSLVSDHAAEPGDRHRRHLDVARRAHLHSVVEARLRSGAHGFTSRPR